MLISSWWHSQFFSHRASWSFPQLAERSIFIVELQRWQPFYPRSDSRIATGVYWKVQLICRDGCQTRNVERSNRWKWFMTYVFRLTRDGDTQTTIFSNRPRIYFASLSSFIPNYLMRFGEAWAMPHTYAICAAMLAAHKRTPHRRNRIIFAKIEYKRINVLVCLNKIWIDAQKEIELIWRYNRIYDLIYFIIQESSSSIWICRPQQMFACFFFLQRIEVNSSIFWCNQWTYLKS